jgi:hypothetical protein
MSKTKIYYLVSDTTKSGTECYLFATEGELLNALSATIGEDVAGTPGADDDALNALIDNRQIYEAFGLWSETLRDPLDTYEYGHQELNLPASPGVATAHDKLSDLLEDADAANDDIRDAAIVLCEALNATEGS